MLMSTLFFRNVHRHLTDTLHDCTTYHVTVNSLITRTDIPKSHCEQGQDCPCRLLRRVSGFNFVGNVIKANGSLNLSQLVWAMQDALPCPGKGH